MSLVAASDTPGDPPTAAVALASLGWRVAPIAPGQKYPALKAWQDAATDDLAVIADWWAGPYQGHGVGIVTGPDTGLWALDVDVADGKPGMASLAALIETHGPLPETVTVLTGTGGLHLYYQWDAERPINNGMATRLGPGLDIRGAGGQVVAPPTIHPNGRPYTWRGGRDPWSITVAAAPDWLYHLLRDPDGDTGSSTAPLAIAPAGNPTDSIADWVRDHYDFQTELSRDGWQIHHIDGDDIHWTRPGKERRDGASAVLHGPDGPLVVFTTSIPPELAQAGPRTADGSAVSVTLFSYLAAIRARGDRSAFAGAARAEQRRLEGHDNSWAPITGLVAPTVTTGTHGPTADDERPTGFVDLGDWWDNPRPPKAPDLAIRTDGTGLLYLDQLNWVHGDSGSGKTWIVLVAMAQTIAAGHHVAWIHYEDPNPVTVIERLRLLGATRGDVIDRFHYFDPQGNPLDVALLLRLCADHDIVHVGLDSAGEALNAAGISEDADAEVGPWITTVPRALVNHGIGFTAVDHGTKAAQQPLHPSGSKRKRAAVTGAALLAETILAPTTTTDGSFRVTCAKDRHGNHPQGQAVGIAHLRHNLVTGLIDFTITPPDHIDSDSGPHETLVRAVIRAVAENPGATKSQCERLLPTAGKTRRLAAIDDAADRGLIRLEINGQAHRLFPTERTASDTS